MLQAVHFVHANSIIHRDLKPSNVVVNAQHQLKVVDWGLARVFRDDKKIRYENSVCTPWYRAPELILGAERVTHGYGPAIDMWSMGCIFVELLWREHGGRQLRRTLFDPRLTVAEPGGGAAAASGQEKLVLPPGFTQADKNDPSYLTSPPNLWRVITGKLGVPTPADWKGCNELKMWPEFDRMGLTAVTTGGGGGGGGHAGGGGGVVGVGGAGGRDRETQRAVFESELRLAAVPPEAIELAVMMLELNPFKRISAKAALAHPFFTRSPDGNLKIGGAVATPSDLTPHSGLDKAHSDKVKRENERQARKHGGGGSPGAFDDMLGEE
jgi:serine/threonine protein kinase